MPKIQTLFPIGVAIAVVLAFLFLGNKLLDAREDAADWKLRHSALVQQYTELALQSVNDAATLSRLQSERTHQIDEKATEDQSDHEPIVQYITREVTRYVEKPADRCTLSRDWVRLYNSSGSETPDTTTPDPEAAGTTNDDPTKFHNVAPQGADGRTGAGRGDPEQPEPSNDPPAAYPPAGVGARTRL